MMTALVVQPTLVAMGRQRLVTAAWVLGSVVFLAVLVAAGARRSPPRWPPSWPGPAVVLAVLAIGVVGALRDPHRPATDRLAAHRAGGAGARMRRAQ